MLVVLICVRFPEGMSYTGESNSVLPIVDLELDKNSNLFRILFDQLSAVIINNFSNAIHQYYFQNEKRTTEQPASNSDY